MDFIGYDFWGAVLVLVSTMLLASVKAAVRAVGFAVMMVANLCWYLFGISVDSMPMMISSMVLGIVNIYGMVRNILYAKEKE